MMACAAGVAVCPAVWTTAARPPRPGDPGRTGKGIHTMMRALRGAVFAAATAAAVVLVAASPAAAATLPNGDFEAGNLSNWTAAGSATVTTSGPHAGTFAAALGLTPTAT